jgi:hypothetical protein
MNQIKSGFLTSELWLIVLAILLPALNLLSAEEGALGVLAAIAYAFGRSWVKAQGAKEEGEMVIGVVEEREFSYEKEDIERLAQLGYDAYGRNRQWRTWDDKPMPQWSELTKIIQEAWCASTADILDRVKEEVEGVSIVPHKWGRGGGAVG